MADGDYERRDVRQRELAAMNARLERWRREAEAEKTPAPETPPSAAAKPPAA